VPRKIQKYANKEGVKVALIAARDLAAGDRIMNTSVGKLLPPIKAVELRDGKQSITFSDGITTEVALKKDSMCIIDASDAS